MPRFPKQPEPISRPKLLVVEGQDDRRFLQALLRYLTLESDFDVQELEGVGNLGERLSALHGISGFAQVQSLGVIRDADRDAQSAFQSLCSGLRNARLSVPAQPLSVTGASPQVAVFIWPDCQNPGTLETLCLSSVNSNPAMVCVEQYFECLSQKMDVLPRPADKARLHTFLASREKPGLRIGEAAERGYWDWDHPAYDPIKQFLRAL
jgi:hypothetical protein